MDLTFINLFPTITELSDQCNLPTKYEYTQQVRHGTKEQLENYLIKDVIGMVEQYLDWNHFSGVALFSVPLKKFHDRNDILFFRRSDKQDYSICLSTPQTIKIPGHFELFVNFIKAGFEIVDHPNVRYLVGYLSELETPCKIENVILFGEYELSETSLDFRSPSFSGVRTIDMYLTRMGRTVHLNVPPFMVEATQRTNRVLMTTFGTNTKIPERFRPRYTTTILINITHYTEIVDNLVQLPAFIQIYPDGNVIILELQEFVNEFKKFGTTSVLLWYIDN